MTTDKREIPATQTEKAAAFEWLRSLALSTLPDARLAAILLVELSALRRERESAERVGFFVDDGDNDWRQVCEEDTDYSASVKLYTHPLTTQSAPAVPADMVSVPREPTRAMENVALDVGRYEYGHGVTRASVAAIYRAMLAAAQE